MKRFAVAAAAAAAFLAPPALAAPPAQSWAAPQIKLVTARGLMGGDPTRFRPDDRLTAGELARLVAGLTQKPGVLPANPTAGVTIAGLDAALVRGLGLSDAAAEFASATRAAGLRVPLRFGPEVVARLLGLRVDHPAAQDKLELAPADPATRAEAAYSAAKILSYKGWEVGWVRDLAGVYGPPPVTGWQQRILQTAVDLIGEPYIWGGTSENQQSPFGFKLPGGFDCSGFVWRVYKLATYDGGGALVDTIKGRSTYAMSGEVPAAKRIAGADIQAADVLFFGPGGPKAKPSQIDHAGIYLGGGWFVHSSGQGVALAPLAEWEGKRLAWARRPLAEAGLIPRRPARPS